MKSVPCPFPSFSSFPPHGSGSLQYRGPVEVHMGPPSFRAFLGHKWSASDMMVYSLWASLSCYTGKIPVDTNCTRDQELQAEIRLPCLLDQAISLSLCTANSQGLLPKATSSHTGLVSNLTLSSLCEEIFPASPGVSRCGRANLTGCFSKARYIISAYLIEFLY